MVCDICLAEMQPADGYYLTTREVVTSEAFWIRQIDQISRMFSSFITSKELEGRLAGPIRHCTSQTTAWLVCESCSELFVFDREGARTATRPGAAGRTEQQAATPGGLDQVDRDRCIIAAARAWERLFGEWPTAAIVRPEWAKPADSCDICGKNIYSRDAVGFWTPEQMKDALEHGFFDNGPVRPARSHDGASGWAVCMVCGARCIARMSRAGRGPAPARDSHASYAGLTAAQLVDRVVQCRQSDRHGDPEMRAVLDKLRATYGHPAYPFAASIERLAFGTHGPALFQEGMEPNEVEIVNTILQRLSHSSSA